MRRWQNGIAGEAHRSAAIDAQLSDGECGCRFDSGSSRNAALNRIY